MTFDGWAVALNGVTLVHACGDSQAVWDETGCYTSTVLDAMDAPPDGLDLPDLRTEDVTYYQRDGVKHFSDWYVPRFVTVTGTLGPATGEDCEDECTTVRQQLNELVQAWKRTCCDTELVVYPPCPVSEDPLERIVTGPYGIKGRPRVFKYQWVNRDEQIATFTARFDSVDQRIYILDECGTPGYTNCVQIEPGVELFSVCFSDGTGEYAGENVICFDSGGFCFNTPVTTDDSQLPVDVSIGGTEQVYPEIVLYPPLETPYMENFTTGEYVQLDTTLVDGDNPVTINTENGTAFDSEGNSLTHLLRGSLFLSMFPGNYQWRLLAGGSGDGYATLCWRDTVVSA